MSHNKSQHQELSFIYKIHFFYDWKGHTFETCRKRRVIAEKEQHCFKRNELHLTCLIRNKVHLTSLFPKINANKS